MWLNESPSGSFHFPFPTSLAGTARFFFSFPVCAIWVGRTKRQETTAKREMPGGAASDWVRPGGVGGLSLFQGTV